MFLKKWLSKCGFPNPQQIDQEFRDLLNTLSAQDVSAQELSTDEFIVFDEQVDTSELTIDPSEVYWRENNQSQCFTKVMSKNSLSESVKQHKLLTRAINWSEKSSQIYGSDSSTG